MMILVDNNGSSSLFSKLARMQEDGKLCDFSILVSGYEIKAHKCVLAASCDYFQTSFEFGEESKSKNSIDLTHVGCEPKYVEMIIKSFYTNEIDLDYSCLESVLRIVDYFICESLQNCVATYMVNTLNFHTATAYFLLSVQYNLYSTKLFSYTKWLMWHRFHDYFIYHPDILEASAAAVDALYNNYIFHYCNPMQVIEFLLNNAKTYLTRIQELICQEDVLREAQYKLSNTFYVMKNWFPQAALETLHKWKYHLIQFLEKWKRTIEHEIQNYYELPCLIKWLESMLQTTFDKEKQNKLCHLGDECYICHCDTSRKNSIHSSEFDNAQKSPETIYPTDNDKQFSNSTKVCTKAVSCFQLEDSSENHKIKNSSIRELEMSPLNNSEHSSHSKVKSDKVIEICGVSPSQPLPDNSQQIAELQDCKKDYQANVIVVLAPTGEMASQIMAIEAERGNSRPLLKSPQLEIAFYDIEMKTWRQGHQVDFPVAGFMLEKHAWRMAFFNNCLYLFSVIKKMALEYNILNKHWTHLDGEQLFAKHNNNSPVKSVIPITVGSKLIVLSMSREAKGDGTFQTLQHFFEMNFTSKTFLLTATVHDDSLNQPITKFSSNGDILVTVKASTMMHRKFLSIQYVHIYNAATRNLQQMLVDCAIESGINILTNGDMLYLLGKDGWCRSFNLRTSTWINLNRHPSFKLTGFMSALYVDDVYPALTRVTCQAGRSRWEITTSNTIINSCMKEIYVNEENQLTASFHPSAPFQFMTAACSGRMSKLHIDNMGFPMFNFVDNQMLNFTLSNSMDAGF